MRLPCLPGARLPAPPEVLYKAHRIALDLTDRQATQCLQRCVVCARSGQPGVGHVPGGLVHRVRH